MWAAFGRITQAVSMFTPNSIGGSEQPVSRAAFWFSLIGKAVLFLMVLFIFIWWPVTEYTPAGFDEWSARMSRLPEWIWYLIVIVLVGIGASQIVGQMRGRPTSVEPSIEDDVDFMSDGAPSISRFAGVSEDDPSLFVDTGPNAVIEEWKNTNR